MGALNSLLCLDSHESNSVCKNHSLLLNVSFVIAWAKPEPNIGGFFFFLKEVNNPLMNFRWKSMEPYHHSNRTELPLKAKMSQPTEIWGSMVLWDSMP